MASDADSAEVLEILPQKPPFRFLDRLVSINENGAVGEYTFKHDEVFYKGHFPGNPVTPGVILVEAMCQTGLVALGIYLLGLEVPRSEVETIVTLFTDANVEFERVVMPGETVCVTAEKVYFRRRKLKSNVVLTLQDGTFVAKATVSGMGVSRGNS